MGMPATTLNLGLQASDVSGQHMVNVRDVPRDSTIGELVQGLVARMRLPRNDTGGRPLTYHARLEREGRHLHSSETVSEALQESDRIVLQPNIDAGGIFQQRHEEGEQCAGKTSCCRVRIAT